MTEPRTASFERALAGEPVRIGTENRAKGAAVRQALARFQASGSPEIQIVPVGVSSGVSEQPIGFEEILAGARNRARAAFASGDCALGVGIEDGLVKLAERDETRLDRHGPAASEGVYNMGCAWVTDGEREGSGFSSGFAYPPDCVLPAIRDQAPIGALFDALWQARRDPAAVEASGAREGNIGRLTAGRLTRAEYGEGALVCALVRFLHPDLYD